MSAATMALPPLSIRADFGILSTAVAFVQMGQRASQTILRDH